MYFGDLSFPQGACEVCFSYCTFSRAVCQSLLCSGAAAALPSNYNFSFIFYVTKSNKKSQSLYLQ